MMTLAHRSTLLFILWQSGGGCGEVPTENLVFYNLLQNIIRTFANHSTLLFILWQSGGGRGEPHFIQPPAEHHSHIREPFYSVI